MTSSMPFSLHLPTLYFYQKKGGRNTESIWHDLLWIKAHLLIISNSIVLYNVYSRFSQYLLCCASNYWARPSRQAWWGIRLGCRCLSPFHLHTYFLWRCSVALGHHDGALVRCWGGDSGNHILYPESPWGLVRLPLMNFSLPPHHYCHCKDGDNYLIYYPEAPFILGQRDHWKQKAHLCSGESWRDGFPNDGISERQGVWFPTQFFLKYSSKSEMILVIYLKTEIFFDPNEFPPQLPRIQCNVCFTLLISKPSITPHNQTALFSIPLCSILMLPSCPSAPSPLLYPVSTPSCVSLF